MERKRRYMVTDRCLSDVEIDAFADGVIPTDCVVHLFSTVSKKPGDWRRVMRTLKKIGDYCYSCGSPPSEGRGWIAWVR